jgi:hypothetical protein
MATANIRDSRCSLESMTRASEADELADDRYRRVDPVALITPVPDNAERARNSGVLASFAYKLGVPPSLPTVQS